MRGLLAVPLLLAALPCFGQEVTDTADRFTGARVIAYTAKAAQAKRFDFRNPSFTVKARVKGPDVTAGVSLLFASPHNPRASSWRYTRCHEVYWLADGKPVAADSAIHQGDVVRGGVLETVMQVLPVASMSQIANAQRVEYRVCSDEFELTPTDIAAFKTIVAKLGQPTTP